MPCPDLTTLERAVRSGDGLESFMGHLDSCDACKERVHQLRADSDLAGELRRAILGSPGHAPTELPELEGFEVLDEIHRGGQGIVYRALQHTTNRVVAIKVLLDGAFATQMQRQRFEREIELAARLDHPGIVAVHASGTSEDGRAFVVMEYIEGVPTTAYAGPRDMLDLFGEICDAVEAAHVRGVLHRDLKPANILVDLDGRPHVLDFGLAVPATREPDEPRLTLAGEVVGTLAYASPEHVGGHDEIDTRSDVYALGVILYELLCGRMPYDVDGAPLEVFRAICEHDPDPLSQRDGRRVDPELATIVLKALRKERSRRYASVGALAADIRHYQRGEPLAARRSSAIYVLRKTVRRYRWQAAAVALLFLGTIVSSITIAVLYGRALDNLDRAESAESEGSERLRESLLAQARAHRSSGLQGQRRESLAAIEAAARIRPGVDVRNEAIASLACIDLVRETGSLGRIFDTNGQTFLDHDFQLLVLAANDGTLDVRTIDGSHRLALLEGPQRPTPHVEFSPDGRWLAVKYGDWFQAGEVWVWDWKAQRVVHRCSSITGRALTFHPDGSRFVVGEQGGTLRSYEVGSWRELAVIESGLFANRLRYSTDGEWLAIVADHRVQLVRAGAGSVERTLVHPRRVHDVTFSRGGSTCVTACIDKRAYSWNLLTGEEMLFEGHDAAVTSVAFAAGDEVLLTSSWDGTTRAWDPRSGQQLLLSDAGIPYLHVDPSGTRVGIVSAAGQGYLATLLTSSIHRHVALQTMGAFELAIDLESGMLAVGSTDGTRLFELSTGRPVGMLPSESVYSVFFDQQARQLWTCGDSGLIRWPLGRSTGALTIGPPVVVPLTSEYERQKAHPSADERLIAVNLRRGGVGQAVGVIDMGTGVLSQPLLDHPGVHDVAISPDGRWLASAPWNGDDILVWDRAETPPRQHVLLKDASRGTVRFSPTGTMVATSSRFGYDLWSVGDFERLQHWDAAQTTGADFSPDGSLLALLKDEHGVVSLVDTASGEEVARLEAPQRARVAAIEFSPDGRWLVTVGASIHLWDLDALQTQLTLIGVDWPGSAAPRSVVVPPLNVEAHLGEFADPRNWRGAIRDDSLRAALDSLNRELGQDADSSAALIRRARVSSALERPVDALVDYDRLLSTATHTDELMLERGTCLEKAGFDERAEADFTEALALRPPDAPLRLIDIEALLRRARARHRLGRVPAAMQDLERVLAAYPHERHARQGLAWLLAWGPSERRDPVRAELLARSVATMLRDDPAVWNTLAGVLVAIGDIDGAEEALRNAILRRTRPIEEDDLLLALCCHARGDLNGFHRARLAALAARASGPQSDWMGLDTVREQVRLRE